MNTVQQTPSTITSAHIQAKFSSSSTKENQQISTTTQNEKQQILDQKSQQVNIFSQKCQGQKGVNIFAKKQAGGAKINIFKNDSKSVNLFNHPSQNANIFKSNSKPLVPSKQQDEGSTSSHCSSNSKNQKEFKVEPQVKIMKFTYQDSMQKITSYSLTKIRIDTNPCKENIYLTLQKSKDHLHTVCFVVRNSQNKLSVYQGIIVNNLSKASKYLEKDQNVRINVYNQNKENSTLKQHTITMQFQTAESAKDFIELVKKLFENTSPEQEKLCTKNKEIDLN